MTIQCPITVTVTAPAPVTPTISAACEAWIENRGINLNAVTSDDVFAALSAVNSGVIDYACGQAIAAAYQSPPPPAPAVQYAASDGSTPAGTVVCLFGDPSHPEGIPAVIKSYMFGGMYLITYSASNTENLIDYFAIKIGAC